MKKPIDQNLRQAVQFLLFSCTAGVIQTISFALFSEVCHFPYWPSYLIALIFSVVYNFTVNRRFTFRSAANVPAAMMKVFGYYCVFTPLSTWWGDTLTKAGWNDFLVLFGTMAIILVSHDLNYVARCADQVVLLDQTVRAHGKPSEVFVSEAFRSIFGNFVFDFPVDQR